MIKWCQIAACVLLWAPGTLLAQDIERPLRELAAEAKLIVGTAVDTDALASNQAYARIVATEFSSVTAENAMKWERIEPMRGHYEWTAPDALVDFANRHDQDVRGHTLLWHQQLPVWLIQGVTDGTISKGELRDLMIGRIKMVADRYKGRISQWDVVNEAFSDEGAPREDSIWTQTFGDTSYVIDAFIATAEADPHAKLYYNDYNLEWAQPKIDAVLKLVDNIRAAGGRIDGVGLQGHLGLQYGLGTTQELMAILKQFTHKNLDVALTEVDVRMYQPGKGEAAGVGAAAQRYIDTLATQAQAIGFANLLQACLMTARCTSYTVWGFADQYSWIPGWSGEVEGLATLYTEGFEPKPAYHAMRAMLALAAHER